MIAAGTAIATAVPVRAQVANPIAGFPDRAVHPSIADPAPALQPVLGAYASPLFAAVDGAWNHGEGFVGSAIDRGGFRDNDDGTSVPLADVNTAASWSSFTWHDRLNPPVGLHPESGALLRRLEGYLRPPNLPLPTVHPLYGAVGSYVDQGAFELFAPAVAYASEPTLGAPRGAFGVVGLLETDLEAWSGREILVATMSGDLLVVDADTLSERWRTHVDGSIGFFNSLVAADLNHDSHDEIYVAGSRGLWRFTQQSEETTP